MEASNYEIVPIEGESVEGRQYGWRILKDGVPYLDCTTGGTSACWNIDDADVGPGEEQAVTPLHICDIDEMIGALVALRDSEVNAQHVARWEWPPANPAAQ
jgi:hypothetical protein